MSDRGMKKWNAYKTLPEHDPAIRNKIKERKGEIFTITTTIKKIDAFNRKLITINEERISFSELISLKRTK